MLYRKFWFYESMADIAGAVLELYHQFPKTCGLSHNEFTVLAAIVAKDAGSGKVEVLSLATGTKCCGEAEHGEVRKEGTIVGDSHAEILARRAFHLYVLESISALLAAGEVKVSSSSGSVKSGEGYGDGDGDENILELVDGKAKLKKDTSLTLYISDNPCGDASIYSRRGMTEDEEGFTGAKRVRKCDSESSEGFEERQEVGVLRTKSGRSDIPDKYRTASMSCSDKICRWLQLGLQGSLLSPFVEILPIRRIIVGLDPLASEGSQLAALKRALISRVEGASVEVEVVDSSSPSFSKGKCMAQEESLALGASEEGLAGETADKKKRKRGVKPRPSGSSVNWVRDVRGSSLSIDRKTSTADRGGGKKKDKTKKVKNGTLEVTQAQSGSLLGISKAMIGALNGSSRLCSRKRALHLACLIRQSSTLLDPSIKSSLKAASEGVVTDKNEDEALISLAVSMSYHWWKTVDRGNSDRKRSFLSKPHFRDWLVDQQPHQFPIGAKDNV